MPNALLIYPEHPPTYWGNNYALELLGIKAVFPPLGLLTVAAMFPSRYNLRLVDLNVTALEDADLEWADLAFTSTMIPQRPSLEQVVERCNRARVPVIAGGPHPTTFHEEMTGIDHFVLDEVEETFSTFLRDLENGTAKAVYRAPRKPDMTKAPVPRFDLINLSDYHSMCLQFSRGCPFDCEFCDITKLYGRVSRTKSPKQMVAEFDHLYDLGWRGPLFLVDDNFIGNKREVSRLLPVLAEWQQERGHPFSLFTEASVNLVRMNNLMDVMIDAGFDAVFLGIETPNPKALKKMKKPQNLDMRDDNYLFTAVRKIQQKGMMVLGGFILGLDDDDDNAFDAQIEFIQETGIPIALVGLLTALKGTNLWARLERENRLLDKPVEIDADRPELQAANGSPDARRRVPSGRWNLVRFDLGELLRPLPDPAGKPQSGTAPPQAGEQARPLCGHHADPAAPDAGPVAGVLTLYRQGVQGPSPIAAAGNPPGRHGLSLREAHAPADCSPEFQSVSEIRVGFVR